MLLTGAQIVWETLLREGVDLVFGYPGGTILPTYDAMPAYPVRHILVRHEQAAVHMAEGYARVTGKVGVCLATSGPGATNLVTGLANAMMDSIPIVAITGQVATNLLGNDAFQETDVTGVTLPITKYNYLITDIRDLGEALAEAFYIARTGRPGPVLVDICKDVQNTKIDWHYPEKLSRPGLHKAQPLRTLRRVRCCRIDQQVTTSPYPCRRTAYRWAMPSVSSSNWPRRPRSPWSRPCWASA